MTVIVGTTLTTFAMADPHAWGSWLRNAERQQAMAAEAGHDLRHFAAVETDARGIEPFADLVNAIDSLGGEWWTYSLDDGRTKVDMGGSRWRHITMGQNIVTEYCQSRPDVDWLLFLAADCAAPSDIVPRMLEMTITLPEPRASMCGAAAFSSVSGPSRLTDCTSRQTSALTAVSGAIGPGEAALLTTISTAPKPASVFATSASIWAGTPMSVGITSARRPIAMI